MTLLELADKLIRQIKNNDIVVIGDKMMTLMTTSGTGAQTIILRHFLSS